VQHHDDEKSSTPLSTPNAVRATERAAMPATIATAASITISHSQAWPAAPPEAE